MSDTLPALLALCRLATRGGRLEHFGHTYWLKADSKDCFIFETLDPPGTFVPPHNHPTQDEYIYML
jgi:hypothetical protein